MRVSRCSSIAVPATVSGPVHPNVISPSVGDVEPDPAVDHADRGAAHRGPELAERGERRSVADLRDPDVVGTAVGDEVERLASRPWVNTRVGSWSRQLGGPPGPQRHVAVARGGRTSSPPPGSPRRSARSGSRRGCSRGSRTLERADPEARTAARRSRSPRRRAAPRAASTLCRSSSRRCRASACRRCGSFFGWVVNTIACSSSVACHAWNCSLNTPGR